MVARMRVYISEDFYFCNCLLLLLLFAIIDDICYDYNNNYYYYYYYYYHYYYYVPELKISNVLCCSFMVSGICHSISCNFCLIFTINLVI